MNLIEFQIAVIVAIVAANVIIALSNDDNILKKLNYQNYVSQFRMETESRAYIDMDWLILHGNVVPQGTKTYITGVRPTANGTDFCGGSLITPMHVLTAAHCIVGDIQYVSVGTHFLSGTEDGEQLKVVNKIPHPKYVSETHSYDLMVLELEKPSSYPPIALAQANDTNGNATVMGWGATSQNGEQSKELLRVDIPIMNFTACGKILEVDDTMLCAGGELDMDSCQGDSGGPLIVEHFDEDVLIGVVSWGNGCGRAGYPGVYARVSVAIDWLQSVAPAITLS
ncbi:serine protease family [Plasmopara halstedii]|uniref:Serine protease family n=1 Tax=Plasmopara halstedii TaxID=4781 RepID=A0A0P1A895_PLAHL|nr:serine protease family [Plasmopara halstedii]CEG36524.1 serine protease family [Plasmopara halstedii]|eukprot:XP_024572893.1 serine protease family [Plasmopara halstedii]